MCSNCNHLDAIWFMLPFPPCWYEQGVGVAIGNALTSLSPFLNVLLCDLVLSNLTGTGTRFCDLIWKYAQLCASCFVNGNWWCLKNMHKFPIEVNKKAASLVQNVKVQEKASCMFFNWILNYSAWIKTSWPARKCKQIKRSWSHRRNQQQP